MPPRKKKIGSLRRLAKQTIHKYYKQYITIIYTLLIKAINKARGSTLKSLKRVKKHVN